MLNKYKFSVGQFFNNPSNMRAVLILGTLLVAALAGAAPSDYGH